MDTAVLVSHGGGDDVAGWELESGGVLLFLL